MIRVLLADDHPVFRAGLALVIESDPRFKVVGRAANGAELLELMEILDLDVACLDINMPGASGLELLPAAKRLRPRVKVLILTQYSEKQMALRAVRAGADGYLTKDAPPAELLLALDRLSQGHRYFSAEVAELLATKVNARDVENPHETLSNREMRVFRMLAAGESIVDIGHRLNLSPKTVSTYRSRLLEKLGLRTNADLVRYAIEKHIPTGAVV